MDEGRGRDRFENETEMRMRLGSWMEWIHTLYYYIPHTRTKTAFPSRINSFAKVSKKEGLNDWISMPTFIKIDTLRLHRPDGFNPPVKEGL
jgi:hypothetical protein